MPEHDIDLRILRALRRIIRNAEQHSKALLDKHNVTAPQLICLRELVAAGMMPVLALAEQVGMSASTVVGIVDRLEQRKLVTRRRDLEDRRLVWIEPTEMGNALANSDASPLQYQLALSLAQLPLDEQLTIAASLERVVALMDMKPYDRSELPAIEPAPLPPPEEKEAPTLDG
ncbi:MarR family winged helix-turn-helix transcriptional regulator [Chromobacterium phragmitis]|nr:MarR family transcriptional regulator [Chromobacterium phragmitis]